MRGLFFADAAFSLSKESYRNKNADCLFKLAGQNPALSWREAVENVFYGVGFSG